MPTTEGTDDQNMVVDALRFKFTRRHGLLVGVALVLVTAAAWVLWPAGDDAAEASGPEVYIVATFDGGLASSPSSHSPSKSAAAANGVSSDWAGDWGASEGTEVKPDLKGPYGTTLVVKSVFPVCSGGAGGTGVTIDVRAPNGGPAIGAVSYLHLNNLAVSPGQTVYPDTVLGVVGTYPGAAEDCWDGAHVHIEGYNYSQGDQSCYYETAASPGARLGRVGGSDVPTGGPQACAG
ncbi:M23 family metallopeptidase [Nocardioides sp.]|uniref:M23 family metallopeptidase n=1 Tax=Nocardioides sp. TaxID=35761 RepID=UPI002721FD6E|nr:M23 family metallopeptidase [Nocardioides sp.]MDO9455977.1 M23 family metallopeptidase [Nocardioides sp.]